MLSLLIINMEKKISLVLILKIFGFFHWIYFFLKETDSNKVCSLYNSQMVCLSSKVLSQRKQLELYCHFDHWLRTWCQLMSVSVCRRLQRSDRPDWVAQTPRSRGADAGHTHCTGSVHPYAGVQSGASAVKRLEKLKWYCPSEHLSLMETRSTSKH